MHFVMTPADFVRESLDDRLVKLFFRMLGVHEKRRAREGAFLAAIMPRMGIMEELLSASSLSAIHQAVINRKCSVRHRKLVRRAHRSFGMAGGLNAVRVLSPRVMEQAQELDNDHRPGGFADRFMAFRCC